MNEKTKKEQEATRKRFQEMSEKEQKVVVSRLSGAVIKLADALVGCGFNNGKTLQMLAFAVTYILPIPEGHEDDYCAMFVKELKRCNRENNEFYNAAKKGGDV